MVDQSGRPEPARRRCCEGNGGGRGGGVGIGRGSLLEPTILAALARSEAHGYDLVRIIEEMTDGDLTPDPGGLYRMLRRFEAAGTVISTWEDGDAGPQRRAYTLTDEGRVLLGHWLAHLEERRRVLDVLIDEVRAGLPAGENAETEGGTNDART